MSVNFEAIATRLGCTPRAVQERLKKLKKMAVDQANGVALPAKRVAKKDDGPSLKKRKTTAKTSEAATKGGKGKQVAQDADDDDDIESEKEEQVDQEMQDDQHEREVVPDDSAVKEENEGMTSPLVVRVLATHNV